MGDITIVQRKTTKVKNIIIMIAMDQEIITQTYIQMIIIMTIIILNQMITTNQPPKIIITNQMITINQPLQPQPPKQLQLQPPNQLQPPY